MTPRVFGIVLLVCACALTGVAAEQSRRTLLRAVESWCTALESLCCELEYRSPPLPELLDKAARRAGGAAGRTLAALLAALSATGSWEQAMKALPALLPQAELSPVREALQVLGVYPAKEQLIVLSETRRALIRTAEELHQELRSKSRVSRAAGLSLGLMLAFLLW